MPARPGSRSRRVSGTRMRAGSASTRKVPRHPSGSASTPAISPPPAPSVFADRWNWNTRGRARRGYRSVSNAGCMTSPPRRPTPDSTRAATRTPTVGAAAVSSVISPHSEAVAAANRTRCVRSDSTPSGSAANTTARLANAPTAAICGSPRPNSSRISGASAANPARSNSSTRLSERRTINGSTGTSPPGATSATGGESPRPPAARPSPNSLTPAERQRAARGPCARAGRSRRSRRSTRAARR